MMSFSRLIVILLVSICAVALAAPKQMVFGFGKRSLDSIDDEYLQDVPMKRYKTKNFAMGFGKRGSVRSFNMGFGKRSADDFELPEQQNLRVLRSIKDETEWGRKFSMGLGKRSSNFVEPLNSQYE